MKERIPAIRVKVHNHPADEIKIIISPARFGEGGAAILVIENKNHHIERIGATEIDPRKIIILRVCKREYTIPTSANSPEEHSP
jgi:hypothetical protein